jgi:site-specific DNA-methyltransferase (adenine-specific)
LYKNNRIKDFNNIIESLNKYTKNIFINNETILINEDSLKILKKIPSNSISLILTDPPYHSTKKKNILGDTNFKSDEEFINWIELYSLEWYRILKPNGSIYMFCSSKMSAKLEVMISKHFNILSNIIWTKPNEPGFDGWKQKINKTSLRQWYPNTERIIFATPAINTNLHRSYFADFLKTQRKISGLSGNKLTELIGEYGKVNHGGAVSNWETGRNIPNRNQYKKICEALLNTEKIKELPYYEDVIRPFEVNSKIEYTDVWNFYSVKYYNGKHPAEKPLDMLEHIIKSSSFEGDIILDCFAGSGNTCKAAKQLNRKSIGIELETKLYNNIILKMN